MLMNHSLCRSSRFLVLGLVAPLLGLLAACGDGGDGTEPGGSGGTGDQTNESGGEPGLGASSGETGGSGGAGTSGGSGGETVGTTGGAAGSDTGGTGGGDGDPTVDVDGCPLTLEGFATVNADGQNGTTGGLGGETVTVTTQAELEEYAGAGEPYVVRVASSITISPKGKEVNVASNKTIIGVGADVAIIQGGFRLIGSSNVILRNLTIKDSFVDGDYDGKTQDYDGIQMDTAHHVWIDHCHLTHMGDGLIDSRADTTYLTVSWNVLSDHNKAFGIGWTANVTAQMTIHHNWLRDLNQRNPSTDNVLRAHLYNNWMQRLGSYGNYARGGTNMVLENSVFEDVPNPYYYDTGSLVAIGNTLTDVSGQQESSGSSYSFFDPSDYYEYQLDAARDVPDLLEKCAGPRATLGN